MTRSHNSTVQCAALAVAAGSAGLTEALCALSFFRHSHRWKEKGSRKGLLRNVRIKDWSHYGEQIRFARRYIGLARAAGWRGSIVAAISSPNNKSSEPGTR